MIQCHAYQGRWIMMFKEGTTRSSWHCVLARCSLPSTNWVIVPSYTDMSRCLQGVLDLVAAELEQEEELRAQHARDKKQVCFASSCLHDVVTAGCIWVNRTTHVCVMPPAALAAVQRRCKLAASVQKRCRPNILHEQGSSRLKLKLFPDWLPSTSQQNAHIALPCIGLCTCNCPAHIPNKVVGCCE